MEPPNEVLYKCCLHEVICSDMFQRCVCVCACGPSLESFVQSSKVPVVLAQQAQLEHARVEGLQ